MYGEIKNIYDNNIYSEIKNIPNNKRFINKEKKSDTTLFKIIYNKYINFSIEPVDIEFNDIFKFNKEIDVTPPIIGDLIHKTYLQIKIPKISILKTDVGIDTSDIIFKLKNQKIFNDYKKINNVYMKIFINIYKLVDKIFNTFNMTFDNLIYEIKNYVKQNNILSELKKYNKLLKEQSLINKINNNILDYKKSNLYFIINQISSMNKPSNIKKIYVFEKIKHGLDYCYKVQEFFWNQYLNLKKKIKNYNNLNIKSAWVKNLGFSIIEYIDIYIGSNRIDRHTGIWLNIWYQLTKEIEQDDVYNKLIGNVNELNNLDYKEKPSYTLIIPMSHWFNKFSSLSFPLINVEHNKLNIKVKLRKFQEVYFIERIYKCNVNGKKKRLTSDIIDFLINQMNYKIDNIELIDISLDDIWDKKDKIIYGNIIIDYIYLNDIEKKKIRKSSHEYLIEIIKFEKTSNINEVKKINIKFDLNNISKEIFWIFQKNIYTENYVGWNMCQWCNYSTGRENKNPIKSCQINFNNNIRLLENKGCYFNIYQPYIYHNTSVQKGINIYSFSLYPRLNQPSGSCDFSSLKKKQFLFSLDNSVFKYYDTEIYPYDTDINFLITIKKKNFINNIDIDFYETQIKNMKEQKNYVKLEEYIKIQYFYNNIVNQDQEIELDLYRKIKFKTLINFIVFNLSLNILRFKNGYAGLGFV